MNNLNIIKKSGRKFLTLSVCVLALSSCQLDYENKSELIRIMCGRMKQ